MQNTVVILYQVFCCFCNKKVTFNLKKKMKRGPHQHQVLWNFCNACRSLKSWPSLYLFWHVLSPINIPKFWKICPKRQANISSIIPPYGDYPIWDYTHQIKLNILLSDAFGSRAGGRGGEGDTHMSAISRPPFLNCHFLDDTLLKWYWLTLYPNDPFLTVFIPDDPLFCLFSAARPFKCSHILLKNGILVICLGSLSSPFSFKFYLFGKLCTIWFIQWIYTPMPPPPFCTEWLAFFKLCTEWPLFFFWDVYWITPLFLKHYWMPEILSRNIPVTSDRNASPSSPLTPPPPPPPSRERHF